MGRRKRPYCHNKCKNNKEDNNKCYDLNSDISGGFQDIDPMLLLVIFEILSNVMSNNLPTNVANAIGNWLQLISATITFFNAQQQYQQGGPGRYYNPKNRNVTNPFCDLDVKTDGKEYAKNKKTNKNNTNTDALYYEIEKLKEEINKLKNKEP